VLCAPQFIRRLIETARFVQHTVKQESPADADKPARRKSMQKLLQFDVFRFTEFHFPEFQITDA